MEKISGQLRRILWHGSGTKVDSLRLFVFNVNRSTVLPMGNLVRRMKGSHDL
jgi:hypothetical protein